MENKNIEISVIKIIELNLDENKTKELLFELYSKVANHYDNKVPESIFNIFIINFPLFKRYVEDIMLELESKLYNINNEISHILLKIDETEEKLKERINIRKIKEYIHSTIEVKYPVVHLLRSDVEVRPSARYLPRFKETKTSVLLELII